MAETKKTPARPALTRYIVKAQGMQLSLRKALKAYRAAGGQIRTSEFVKVWNIVADSPKVYGTKGIVRSG
jgi:hypothetical protein